MKNCPTKVNILITKRCNLKCIHCYLANGKEKTDITLKNFTNIINYFVTNNVSEVVIEGGEPLCHSHFEDICKLIRKEHFYKKIATNATLVSKEKAKVLSDVFDLIQVSVDGFSRETYEIIRGNNTFDKMENGLKNIVQCGGNVVINYVVTRKNCSDISRAFEFCERNKIQKIKFLFVYDETNILQPNTEDVRELFDIIHRLEKKGIQVSVVFPESKIPTDSKFFNSHKMFDCVGICYSGTVYTVIDSDLNVFPCNFRTNGKPLFRFSEQFERDWNDCQELKQIRQNNYPIACKGCPSFNNNLLYVK